MGNIPYGNYLPPFQKRLPQYSYISGLTEEQIKDIFGSAGKVMSFRLVYDRETGRPKGFGFVEFPDSGSQLLHLPREAKKLMIVLDRFCSICSPKSQRI